MKREEFLAYVGKTISCDMVNRERPVAKLLEVTDDGYLVLKDPYVYIPLARPGGGFTVQAVQYAAPMYEVPELRVHCEHVVAILDVPQQMEEAYIRDTSGLIPVQSGLILPN